MVFKLCPFGVLICTLPTLGQSGCERHPQGPQSATGAGRPVEGVRDGFEPLPRAIVGNWVVDNDRQFMSMVEAAERDLGPLPTDLRERFWQTARDMYCEYDFRTNRDVTIRYRTNPESHATESGTWRVDGQRILVETRKDAGHITGPLITRELWLENDYLVTQHPSSRVRWYLRRR